MCKTRVLVVDSSLVARRMITGILVTDPALEALGTASSSHTALEQIAQARPDIVTLDIDMPEADGPRALAEIRRLYPQLPVIVLSGHPSKSALAIVDALIAGANDFVAKPSATDNVAAAMQRLREELVPRIKSFAPNPVQPEIVIAAGANIAKTAALGPETRVDVIAIGAGAGGPAALAHLLTQLPPKLPVPIAIVQHLAAPLTRALANKLNEYASFPVREGVAGTELYPGSAWLAPAGYHVVTVREQGEPCLQVNQNSPENGFRPAINVLLESTAKAFGAGVLAVLLTGNGRDGLRGCACVRAAGGQVFLQDERSSVAWGMAGAVEGAGLASEIVPLDGLAAAIARRVQTGRKPAGR